MLSLTCEFGNIAFHLAWSPGANHFLRAVTSSCGVAAGVSPAVEPGILPGGQNAYQCKGRQRYLRFWKIHTLNPGGKDAALYGSQDGCRYVERIHGASRGSRY